VDPAVRVSGDKPPQTASTLNLGDLINLFYEEYLALYQDEDVASVAAAATINDILRDADERDLQIERSPAPKKETPEP